MEKVLQICLAGSCLESGLGEQRMFNPKSLTDAEHVSHTASGHRSLGNKQQEALLEPPQCFFIHENVTYSYVIFYLDILPSTQMDYTHGKLLSRTVLGDAFVFL